MSGKGNEAYEKLSREIGAKYGHLLQRIDPNAPVREFKPAPDPIYCPAQTYRQTRDEPAEYCTEEVADHGDLCSKHDEDDRSDADYEAYKESRYDD
jgi:hypothetical protein